MKKILYIVSTLRHSGPTNQLYGLIKNLDRNKFKPTILTLSPEPKNSKYNMFNNLDIEIDSLGLSRLNMFIFGKSKLVTKVNEIKPDLIHTSGIRPDTYTNKYLSKFPQVNTIRNYVYDDYPVKFNKILGYLMAKKHLKCFKKIDYPVSCSYAIKNKYEVNHNIATDVVQNGIDASKFNTINKDEKLNLRNELNLNKEKTIFITVGSLIDRKDPVSLINAFKDLHEKDNSKLLILGDGPLLDKCKEIKDESIILKGHVNNVNEYLKASDVFVSASKSEGLPNAVLEAMGSGLPVLLSDIEPHKEILERNNNIGDLFELGNVKELSNLINTYRKVDLESKGKEAREVLKEYFSAEVMSNSYQDLYLKILDSQ